MSGRRMKAIRRAIYGDDATNVASRQYRETKGRRVLGPVVSTGEAGKGQQLFAWFRGDRVRLDPRDQLYREAKRAVCKGNRG